MAKIGYARVSTIEQSLSLQYDALRQAGCEKIFDDVISAVDQERAGLNQAFEYLREGDILIIWKLDRLGRSLKHLVELINQLNQMKVELCSLQENIDTTSVSGRLIFHVFAAIAEFERDLIRQRANAGLKASRAMGRLGGRPSAITPEKLAIAKSMLGKGEMNFQEIYQSLGVSRATLYRHLALDKG